MKRETLGGGCTLGSMEWFVGIGIMLDSTVREWNLPCYSIRIRVTQMFSLHSDYGVSASGRTTSDGGKEKASGNGVWGWDMEGQVGGHTEIPNPSSKHFGESEKETSDSCISTGIR